jgi:sarcosine oxidase subunit beta
VDMTGDRSPILSRTPLGQLLRQLRLGHGRASRPSRARAGPWRAWWPRGEPGPPGSRPFGLDRFREGASSTKASPPGVAH